MPRSKTKREQAAERFEFAPVGYVVVDPAGTILEANVEFSRLTGIPREALRGWALTGFVKSEQRTSLRDFLRLGAEPGESGTSLEVVLQSKNETVPVRLVASADDMKKSGILVAVHASR